MRRTPPAMQRGRGSLRRRANRRAAFDVAEVQDLKARTLAQPRPLVHADHGIPARGWIQRFEIRSSPSSAQVAGKLRPRGEDVVVPERTP